MNIDYKITGSILSTDLPTHTKLVYMALVYHADKDTREAFPSWDVLMREASIKHTALSEALKLLVAHRFIERLKSPGRRSRTFRILEYDTSRPGVLNANAKIPPAGIKTPPDGLLDSATRNQDSATRSLRLRQADTNIIIEHKQLTSASTSVNAAEDEEEFKSMFEEFWKEYPANCLYKSGKERCRKKYAELLLAQSDPRRFHGIVMKGLERWLKSQKWHDANGRYISAPLRWLEESSWEEEPPQRVETEEERIARVKAAVPVKLNWVLCIERCKHCTGNGCRKGVKVPPDQQPHQRRPEECEYFSALGTA